MGSWRSRRAPAEQSDDPAAEPEGQPGDELERARDAALRLLNYRIRSVAEIRQRLADCGHGPAVIDDLVARLTEAGLLDDSAYATAYVRDGVNLKKRGRFRLLRELREQGVEETVAESALEDELPAEDELSMAREIAARRAERLRGLPHDVAMRRLASYLERRGIVTAVVWQVVKDVLPRDEREP